MIAREGYVQIAGVATVALLLGLLAVLVSFPWDLLLVAVGLGLLAFTLFFFRDPARTPPDEAADGTLILAPADGKVVQIESEHEPLYLKREARRVSIFLSPLSVHVNRVPVDGTIEFDEYVPGDYLVAWHPKASEKNERSQLGVRHPSGRHFLFKQIAGAVARRIVYHIGVGDEVRAGDRFGIVKFGSRMDVVVPLDVALEVRVGDHVRAGETILGRIPVTRPHADHPSLTAAKDDTAP